MHAIFDCQNSVVCFSPSFVVNVVFIDLVLTWRANKLLKNTTCTIVLPLQILIFRRTHISVASKNKIIQSLIQLIKLPYLLVFLRVEKNFRNCWFKQIY